MSRTPCKDPRRAMLEADVSLRVVRDFAARLTARAAGPEVLQVTRPDQQVIKIVHELLNQLLGEQEHLNLAGASPAVIMLVGLQGSGKTTASTKRASFLRQQGMSPLLVAANPYRPATSDQLVTLGRQLAIPVYAEPPIVKPIVICQQAHHYAREHGHDVAILDTAQRLCIDDAILDEAAAIGAALQVQEVLLIVDAMTGQESVRVAEEFNARLPLSGLI